MLNVSRIAFKFLAAAAVVLTTSAWSDSGSLESRAQALLDAAREENNLAGMTAGIAKKGEIVWVGATGFQDIANEIPANPEMVHRIASISKPMTAVGAMRLVEYGSMKLDDPLRKYITEMPETPMGEIQIMHLLTHTSGIKHYTGNDSRPFTHYATLTDACDFILNRRSGIAVPPLDRYIYTTYGYTVLALAMERAAGVPYAEYMRDYIWLPAGMRDTIVEVKGVDVPNKSKLYRKDADGNIEEDDYTDLSVKTGGGGIQSTAPDLLRFAIAFEGEKLIKRELMDQMLTIPPLNNPRSDNRPQYGFGWNVGNNKSLGSIIAHSGGQSGTSTYLLIGRDHDIAVSVLCNTAGTGAPADLAYSLARLAAGVPEPTED